MLVSVTVTAAAVAAPAELAASLHITRTAALVVKATTLFLTKILVAVILVVPVARIIPQEQLRQQQKDPIPAAASIPKQKTTR